MQGSPDYFTDRLGQTLVVTINRPHRRNALSRSLQSDLVAELLRFDEDRSLRVLVLTGTGDAAFCSGADIKEVAEQDNEASGFVPPIKRPERSIFEVLTDLSKPAIAAINGTAAGGGFEIALACDLRLAVPTARLGLPEVRVGMAAQFGSVLLPRQIPYAWAMELLLTGELITAERAEQWGLVNQVVPAGELMARATALADRIAQNAPLSVVRVKAVASRGLGIPTTAALRLNPGPDPLYSEDRKEGIRAFLENRKPQWRNC
jgi:enoyl-CoA hydratase